MQTYGAEVAGFLPQRQKIMRWFLLGGTGVFFLLLYFGFRLNLRAAILATLFLVLPYVAKAWHVAALMKDPIRLEDLRRLNDKQEIGKLLGDGRLRRSLEMVFALAGALLAAFLIEPHPPWLSI